MEITEPPRLVHPLDAAAHYVGGRPTLAQMLGVSLGAIGNWKARGMPIGPCLAIERATGGKVTRKDLRPVDWQDIWPEIAQALESISLPATETVAQAL